MPAYWSARLILTLISLTIYGYSVTFIGLMSLNIRHGIRLNYCWIDSR